MKQKKINKITSLLMCGVLAPWAMYPITTSYAEDSKEETSTVDTNNTDSTQTKQKNESSTEEKEPGDKTESGENPDNTDKTKEEDSKDKKENESKNVESVKPQSADDFFKNNYDKEKGYVDAELLTNETEGLAPITLKGDMPKSFKGDVDVILVENNHENTPVRITLHEFEDFDKKIYLPEGSYSVTRCEVEKSETLSFKLSMTKFDLKLLKGDEEPLNIIVQMQDKDNVVSIAEDDSTYWVNRAVTNIPFIDIKEKLFEVEQLPGVQSDKLGVLYYTASHTGAETVKTINVQKDDGSDEMTKVEEISYENPGKGYVGAYGNAIRSRDIAIKIIKKGVTGESKFAISYDNGQSYQSQEFTTSDSFLDENIGLTYIFKTAKSSDEWKKGDVFRFSSIESFSTENTATEDARIVCYGHPAVTHDLKISILSSGGRGVSKVKVEDSKGNIKEQVYAIPDNGVISLKTSSGAGDDLTLLFQAVEGYEQGVNYEIKAEAHDAKVNYTTLYILAGIAFAIGLAAWAILLTKKEKKSEYVVNQYDWKQQEEEYSQND